MRHLSMYLRSCISLGTAYWNPTQFHRYDIVHRSNGQDKVMAEVIKCSVCGQTFNSLSVCVLHLKSTYTVYGIDGSECTVVWENEYFCEKYGQTFGFDRNALELHIESMYMRKSSNDDIKHTSISNSGDKPYAWSMHYLYQDISTKRWSWQTFPCGFPFWIFFHFFKWYLEFTFPIFYLNCPMNSHC